MTIAIENGKRNQRARWPTPDELLCLAASPVFAVMALHATKAEMGNQIPTYVKRAEGSNQRHVTRAHAYACA